MLIPGKGLSRYKKAPAGAAAKQNRFLLLPLPGLFEIL
jgi:hypothetical protein